jgi:hypothetical protein
MLERHSDLSLRVRRQSLTSRASPETSPWPAVATDAEAESLVHREAVRMFNAAAPPDLCGRYERQNMAPVSYEKLVVRSTQAWTASWADLGGR